MCKVVCVTNRQLCQNDFLKQIEKVAAAKPEAIILREKDLTEEEYKKLATEVLEICSRYRVQCILHYFVEVAVELGAIAIHLPMAQLQKMTEEKKKHFEVIGASCHSLEEVKRAKALGCTYVTAGHVFETKCKEGVPPKGIPFLKEICEKMDIPVYALGGISADNAMQAYQAGAKGVCMMSEFMRAEHPEQLVGKVEAVEKRERYTLYAITNRQDASKETMYEQVKQAILGGATCIQLREKNVDAALFLEEAIALEKICHEAGVLLIINDNVDIAIKSGADGVHVGQDDGSVREIRKRTGEQFIIGVTAKTVDQAKQAYEEGADYLGVGACFASPTKTDAKRITVQQLREIVDSVPIPVVAIGGITKENMVRLKGVRLAGLALVSAVFGATDIAAETKELRHKIQQLFG